MVEVRALSYGEEFGFKGLIDVAGLYKIIEKWFADNGYDKVEVWNFEEVYEDGKQLTWKLEPYKKISDFARVEIRIQAWFKKLKEVVVEKDGLKNKLLRGEVKFRFETFMLTDYENYWGTKPMYFFLRTLADKFIYRTYIDRYEDIALADKDGIKREIKSFLNMQRYAF
jgi:hypothetical protein